MARMPHEVHLHRLSADCGMYNHWEMFERLQRLGALHQWTVSEVRYEQGSNSVLHVLEISKAFGSLARPVDGASPAADAACAGSSTESEHQFYVISKPISDIILSPLMLMARHFQL